MTDHHESSDHPADRHAADMADDRLLDAILRGRAQDTTNTVNARVARVMDEVATTSREPRGTESQDEGAGRFRLISIGRAVAAAVLFGTLLSLMLLVSRPQPAEATLLERAIERMGVEDLTYAITVVPDPDGPVARPASAERRVSAKRHPGPRAFAWKKAPENQGRRGTGPMFSRLDGATLLTRGELWSLLVPTRQGRMYARGFDGEKAWDNRPDDSSRSRSSATPPGENRMRRSMQVFEFAMLDLSQLIIQLDRSYEVSAPEIVDSQVDDSPLVRYEAIRKSRARGAGANRAADPGKARSINGESRRHGLPQTIDIWADPESERIVFLRLSGLGGHGSEETVNLELALESTNAIPDAAFSREGYEELDMPRRPGDRPSTERRREGESERDRPAERPGRMRRSSSSSLQP